VTHPSLFVGSVVACELLFLFSVGWVLGGYLISLNNCQFCVLKTLPSQRTAGSRASHRDRRTVGSSPLFQNSSEKNGRAFLTLLVNAGFCS
jgi:hypothetical protein